MFFRRTNRWQAVCDSLRERPEEWTIHPETETYLETMRHKSGIEICTKTGFVVTPLADTSRFERRCIDEAVIAWTCKQVEAADGKDV